MNILLITADQWRGECLSCLDHPVVKTPHLDALAEQGVLFANHFAQATPCGPSRTSLHTGMYMFNHRCVTNGTPVASRFTNWAMELRKKGCDPSLFGYTDTAVDPTGLHPEDVRLKHYSEPLPGFGHYTPIKEEVSIPWAEYLVQKGYSIPKRWWDLYSQTMPGVPFHQGGEEPLPLAIKAEDHETHFMVDQCMKWIGAQHQPWVTHLSLLRPHPPFVAPAPYNAMYPPNDVVPTRHSSKKAEAEQHPFIAYMLEQDRYACPEEFKKLQEARAQYFGLMSEVDDNLGRLFDFLKKRGDWSETLIIFTSDHGEQMGDHWLWSKLGFYDSSYHIPLIIVDPREQSNTTRGTRVESFTENVDIMPTMLEWMDADIPSQCDGHSLLPFVYNEKTSSNWRTEAYWEYDFRDVVGQKVESALGLTSHQCNMSVMRSKQYKYVHFSALPHLLFDLVNDPDEMINQADNPEYANVKLDCLEKLLYWRTAHTDRGLTETKLTGNGPVTKSIPLY